MAAITVSIINLKGGVGKSTLAMILGEFLVFRYGKRVLLVDMDAQGNLSYCMVPAAQIETQDRNGRTVYHVLKMTLEGKKADISQFVTQPPLVVSNIARSSAMNYPGVIDMVVSIPAVAELDEDLLKLWEEGKPMPNGLRLSLAEALGMAIGLEEKAVAFYEEVAERSQSLLATIPGAFRRVAKRRRRRKAALEAMRG